MPDPKFDGSPEYNFFVEGFRGSPSEYFRDWILQASGVSRAVFLPQGLLDFPPEPGFSSSPPPGRVRLRHREGFLEVIDEAGATLWRASAPAASNFLALTDTPGSYAGQGGLHVAVNAGETGLEFVPAGGAGGSSPHDHSYPAVYYGAPVGGAGGNNYNGFIHWPGWSAMDELHWGNSLNGFLSTTFPLAPSFSYQVETDATTGRRVTSARAVANHEEASGWGFAIHRGIPGDFTGWDVEGISLSHRVAWTGVITTDSLTITVDVYDPTNAGDVVVATASRVVTANDAGFVEITVPQAALDAAGFAPGDILRMRVYTPSVVTGANAIDSLTYLSRISTAWTRSSGGGSGSSTWLGLTDTPNSYAGQAGLVPRVNAGETALEFTAVPAANPLPCSDNTITADLTIPGTKTCYAHDILIAPGVTVTIEAGGELLIL